MMVSPTFDNWKGEVPNGSPQWFETAQFLGLGLGYKAARCLANLAWFLDERQHKDLLESENGRSSGCRDTFKEVMKDGSVNYELIPSKDSSLLTKVGGKFQFDLFTPREMTFEHCYFVAIHLFQGPQKCWLDTSEDDRWREFSSDEAQFYQVHFDALKLFDDVLVFEDSTPANNHNDLRLTDWLAMILSGVMNPHRHYTRESSTRL